MSWREARVFGSKALEGETLEEIERARKRFDREYEIRDDGQIHMSPLNIDAMSYGDLEIASHHPALHLDVQGYAQLLRQARDLRVSGRMADALRYEDRAEALYSRMPKSLRW